MRRILARYREVKVSGIVVGSALSPQKSEFEEKVEEEKRQGFFNAITVIGFAMTVMQFLDSRGKK